MSQQNIVDAQCSSDCTIEAHRFEWERFSNNIAGFMIDGDAKEDTIQSASKKRSQFTCQKNRLIIG